MMSGVSGRKSCLFGSKCNRMPWFSVLYSICAQGKQLGLAKKTCETALRCQTVVSTVPGGTTQALVQMLTLDCIAMTEGNQSLKAQSLWQPDNNHTQG